MDWSILLSLLCPIMMIFCMKGMFSGHNHNGAKNETASSSISPEEMQSLHAKINELTEQNLNLVREVRNLQETVATLKPANEPNSV